MTSLFRTSSPTPVHPAISTVRTSLMCFGASRSHLFSIIDKDCSGHMTLDELEAWIQGGEGGDVFAGATMETKRFGDWLWR